MAPNLTLTTIKFSLARNKADDLNALLKPIYLGISGP